MIFNKITDAVKESRLQKTYDTATQRAVEMFLNQKDAINNIKDTEGLKEIRMFFEREKEASMQLIMSSSKNNEKEKGRYDLADRFLTFLDRLIDEH